MFHPWIGPNYRSTGLDGKRVLIVGESHYAQDPVSDLAGFTQSVVRGYVEGAFTDRRARLFTAAGRLLIGDRGATRQHCRDVWKNVAFCNYLQDFKGDAARFRGGPLDWEGGADAFEEMHTHLQPDAVLFLGKGLWWNAKPRLDSEVNAAYVVHPSGGMKYSDAMPVVDRLLGRTR
ncbi:hypothetical protein [Gaopeijia maritima]|uniref:hypothetical protein n=1 Tax=Gaopeijia maritima TaxID=3119007 RepID=UPI00386B4FAF